MSRSIVLRRSAIHGKGVFALRDIAAGIELVRYRGRVLTHDEVDAIYADDKDVGHTFLFTLNDRYVIDGSVDGNIARWINHSCAPNCEAVQEEWEDPARDRIIIQTVREISAGEELTYDYGIVPEERLTPTLKKIWACRCNAENCTGSLLKPKRGGRRKAA